MVGLTTMSQQFFLSSQDFPGIEVAEASMRQREGRDSQGACSSHWLVGLKLCNHHLMGRGQGPQSAPWFTLFLLPTLISCILLSGMTAIPVLSVH